MAFIELNDICKDYGTKETKIFVCCSETTKRHTKNCSDNCAVLQ